MIPKIIHCCWFSGEEKTDLAKKCRASWAKYAPDWDVHEWNEIPDCAPRFVQEAMQKKKWAFASDWMRFWVLEKEGGVYFDFDVELIASLDGLPNEAWCGTVSVPSGRICCDPGCGIALEKGSMIARKMLSYYNSVQYSEETVGPILEGLLGGEPLERIDVDVFSPIGVDGVLRKTERTRGIHHYAMAWASPPRRIARWLNWHGLGWLVGFVLAVRNLRILKRIVGKIL